MLLTEENCKDVEKIGRLLQVDSVIKCVADFHNCLSLRTGTVDLTDQYRFDKVNNSVEFRHIRSSDIQKAGNDRSLKRGIDGARPSSPLHKRQRYHTSAADDTLSMSQSYGTPDPWDRIPRVGAPPHMRHSSSGPPGVVEDSLELVQTDPPGTVNLTSGKSNNTSVSIGVTSQVNTDSHVQVVNVPETSKKHSDQSNLPSQLSQNSNMSSHLAMRNDMTGSGIVPPHVRPPEGAPGLSGPYRKQQPSPSNTQSSHSSQHSDSSFPSPKRYDHSSHGNQMVNIPSQVRSHGNISKSFAAGSPSQAGLSQSLPAASGVQRSESQGSLPSHDTDPQHSSVDTGQNMG